MSQIHTFLWTSIIGNQPSPIWIPWVSFDYQRIDADPGQGNHFGPGLPARGVPMVTIPSPAPGPGEPIVTLITPADGQVPEPGTWLMLAGGLLILAAAQWMRKLLREEGM